MTSTSRLSRPRLLQLLLVEVTELVDRRRLTSHNTLDQLDRAANRRSVGSRVLNGLRLDLDKTDSWILWAAIVLAVLEITEPGFERRRVELANLLPVGLDGGDAGDGRPLAGVVEEAEVDFAVALEVVGLAGLGVGVEDQVDAVAFLHAGRVSKSVRSFD